MGEHSDESVRAPEEFDEGMGIIIEDREIAEPQPIASFTAPILDEGGTDDEQGTRLLELGRGGYVREDSSSTVELKANETRTRKIMVFGDENVAIGTFIHLLEQHNADEGDVLAELRENYELSGYESYRDSLTPDSQRDRLLADAREKAENGPHIQRYLDDGSWRTVADTETLRRVGENLYDGVNPNPRRCYRNAIVALNALDGYDGATYVEGLVAPKQGGRAVAHAWIEVNERVIELTWPWHAPIPPEEAVYYGVPIETDEVLETTRRRNAGFNPILVTDEELATEATSG